MTDTLHIGASTRRKHQLNTFMRFPTLRRLGLAALTALCAHAGYQAHAQILVGPAGSGTNTFDTQPTVAQGWSTVSVGASAGAFTTPGNLDNHVITNTAATSVATALGSSTTYPPSANGIARWNNNATAGQGFYIQTRTTGNDYLLLQATLQNNTGSNITHVKVDFDWDQRNPPPPVEEISGHRAFYSLTGARNSWILIPEFSTFTVSSTLQHLSATLPLGSWTNGARLYIIWADDNGSAGTEVQASREGTYTIDNFAVAAIPATNVVITQHPITQSVAPGGAVSMSVVANG